MRSHISAFILVLYRNVLECDPGLAGALKDEISSFTIYFIARWGVFGRVPGLAAAVEYEISHFSFF